MSTKLEAMATSIAKIYGLNAQVICAQITVESAWNIYATRYEPTWKWLVDTTLCAKKAQTSEATEKVLQSCSWGLMQVMGSVARELGYEGPIPKLCDPEMGITYGCKKLRACLTIHSNLPDALASYNAGNPNYQAGKNYAAKVMKLLP